MKIQFEGAAQTVTGSQTIVEHHSTATMIDCGLYQGPKELRALNWEKPAHFSRIKSIVLTHAHIDHSGLLPRWAHWGWQGPIYCTPSTADLLEVMLMDAARLQVEDARFANETKHSRHDPALPLYTEDDARRALSMLYPVPFDQWTPLSASMSFRFLRAGHILGSAISQISYTDGHTSKLLTFSGDLGGGHSDLLKEPASAIETDELVLESTYGDRRILVADREIKLARIINKIIGGGGTLIIPAFALGRTQDILLSIHRLQSQKMIPDIPVYLDSPMAHAVTKIYLKHLDELRADFRDNSVEESLSPRFFHGVETPDESMLLCMSEEPKIVLSASGMLQGGRILHHLKKKLPDAKNGVLFVGFQGKETKGRLLQDGIRTLRVHHQEISVEAEIFTIDGYSAHADVDDILKWVKGFRKFPDRIFLNHGEAGAQKALAERIRQETASTIEIPVLHQEFIL